MRRRKTIKGLHLAEKR